MKLFRNPKVYAREVSTSFFAACALISFFARGCVDGDESEGRTRDAAWCECSFWSLEVWVLMFRRGCARGATLFIVGGFCV